jgi:hypothetical protein
MLPLIAWMGLGGSGVTTSYECMGEKFRIVGQDWEWRHVLEMEGVGNEVLRLRTTKELDMIQKGYLVDYTLPR